MLNRGRIIKLAAAILSTCLMGTAVLILFVRIQVGGVLKEPVSVDVQIEAPEQVIVNEPFAVTLQLTNLFTATQTLHSIDFDSDYLENVRLSSAAPAYQAVRPLPFTNYTSYEFNHELPVNEFRRPTVIELIFVGETVGEFSGLMDICLADGTFCLALPLETAVVEE